MTNDTSLKISYTLLLESAKNCKFAKFEFFLAKSLEHSSEHDDIGILFLGCGDNMNKPKEEIEDENFEARLDLFL